MTQVPGISIGKTEPQEPQDETQDEPQATEPLPRLDTDTLVKDLGKLIADELAISADQARNVLRKTLIDFESVVQSADGKTFKELVEHLTVQMNHHLARERIRLNKRGSELFRMSLASVIRTLVATL